MSEVRRGTQEERDEDAVGAVLVGGIPRTDRSTVLPSLPQPPQRAYTQLLSALRAHLKVNSVIFGGFEKKQSFQGVVI